MGRDVARDAPEEPADSLAIALTPVEAVDVGTADLVEICAGDLERGVHRQALDSRPAPDGDPLGDGRQFELHVGAAGPLTVQEWDRPVQDHRYPALYRALNRQNIGL